MFINCWKNSMKSPYDNVPVNKWSEITRKLIAKHPLKEQEIISLVMNAWEDIFSSWIGAKPFHIGVDIFPKPQILAFLLHELIQLEISNKYPKEWRKEKTALDKDIIYMPDDLFSIEIKTSSNPNSIFGNRSYAQETTKESKLKSGYYLAVNFEKCTKENPKPKILKVRFGWLDHEDWMGQKSETGQQARLSRDVETNKLLTLYSGK